MTDGKHLVVKPLSNTEKETRWKAHEGVVLCVDWNPVGGLIVSGGEDRRYRVWDAFGRNLFSSRPLDYVVTSVAIAPSGEHFAVGSYDTLVLCDKGGWSHDHAKPSTGSLFRLAWTHDSTQVRPLPDWGAGANRDCREIVRACVCVCGGGAVGVAMGSRIITTRGRCDSRHRICSVLSRSGGRGGRDG